MKRYRLTLEREDNTWGQYTFDAEDMQSALKHIARSIDLDGARNTHFIEVREEDD